MQQAFPYNQPKTWDLTQPLASGSDVKSSPPVMDIAKVVTENPVVVVGRRGCCLVHVVRRLLQGQGVNPMVCEVGDDDDKMAAADGSGEGEEKQKHQLPAVFIGGRLVGGLDRLMAIHISGELIPILRDAGALWL